MPSSNFQWERRALTRLSLYYVGVGPIIMTAAFGPHSLREGISGVVCTAMIFWPAAIVGASLSVLILQLSADSSWGRQRVGSGFAGGLAFAAAVWLTILLSPSLLMIFVEPSRLIGAAVLTGFAAAGTTGWLLEPTPQPTQEVVVYQVQIARA